MKTRLKISSCLLLSSVTLSAFAADSGNGGGYNGPVLGGPSIPVHTDHGLDLSDVKRAVEACAGNIDRDLPPTTLIDRIQSVIFGPQSLDPKREGYAMAMHQIYKPNEGGQVWAHAISSRNGQINFRQHASNHDFPRICFRDPTASPSYEYMIGYSCQEDKDSIELMALDGTLPSVEFESSVTETVYDDFGQHEYERTLLSGISIQLNSQSHEIHFLNTKTHQRTRFTVDVNDYVECLRSRIQSLVP